MVSCFWFIYFNTCFCTSRPSFTQGSMNSTTTTEQTITETIAIEKYGGAYNSYTGITLLRAPKSRFKYNLFDDFWSRKLAAGNHFASSWSNRNPGHRTNDRNHFNNHFLKCVLSVILFWGGVAHAQNDGTTVVANPQSTSTGSVTNSAVQINQDHAAQRILKWALLQ